MSVVCCGFLLIIQCNLFRFQPLIASCVLSRLFGAFLCLCRRHTVGGTAMGSFQSFLYKTVIRSEDVRPSVVAVAALWAQMWRLRRPPQTGFGAVEGSRSTRAQGLRGGVRTKVQELLLEPRLLAEVQTTNEGDEAFLKNVVTGIERGVAGNFYRTRTSVTSLTRPRRGRESRQRLLWSFGQLCCEDFCE